MNINKIFNLVTTFKSINEEDDGSVTIKGMASTSDFDRAGDTIIPEAWTKGGLEGFKRNPIILFNHDYSRPIGRAKSVTVTDTGLEIEATISKAEPQIVQLIKDGVLGTFSVGFRVKDADYIPETDGLKIKEAELFETSVVSIPCNGAATFSVAKSFDSMSEYKDFVETLNNSVNLAGQSLAKNESNLSDVARNTPDGAEEAHEEIIDMTPEDLQAFAKQVSEETAAKIAMKQAEEKAAAKKAEEAAKAKAAEEEAAKAAQEAEVQTAIKMGVESGADRLVKDFEARLAEKDAKISEVLAEFKTALEEKNEEIKNMRDSKRVFADRTSDKSGDLSAFGKELMYGHLMGVITGKGWDTDYSRSIFEKAGITYPTADPNIATEVSRQIEKEVVLNLRAANLFRQIQMNAQSMVLPIQTDANKATWQTGAAPAGNLANRDEAAANTFQARQVVLQAFRLISQTYMDNHIDEEVLVNLMPMLTDNVARAHARAIDDAILNGNGGDFNGLSTYATASTGGALDLDGATVAAGNSATLTAAMLMGARKSMGKYGIDPSDVAYIVSQARYYDLIADPEFTDVTEVGSNIATKITGSIGAVYGSPVIISDNFTAEAAAEPVAYAVNMRNYAIPRLRGVMVEQDYEVGNQRRVIVATQSLGFNELVPDDAANRSAVKVVATA